MSFYPFEIPPQITNMCRIKKIVVTISKNLEFTEAETSALSKGLTFVSVNNQINEYQVKADCEKYFRRLRLRAYFHGEADALTMHHQQRRILFQV